MPKHCFVTHCESGYLKTRKAGKKVSLFRPPKDSILLEKWRRAIPRSDRLLGDGDFVCELHFDSQYIERFFDKEETLVRETPRLKPTAEPTIFPNCPSYFTKKTPINRSRTERTAARAKTAQTKKKLKAKDSLTSGELSKKTANKRTCEAGRIDSAQISEFTLDSFEEVPSKRMKGMESTNDQVTEHVIPNPIDGEDSTEIAPEAPPKSVPKAADIHVTENSAEGHSTTEEEVEPPLFASLVRESLPENLTASWHKLVLSNVIIRYLYWPSDEKICTKYVDIKKNLFTNVVLGQVSTVFHGYKKIPSRAALYSLLEEVERTKICGGAMKKGVGKCRGFVTGNHDQSRNEFCGPCFTKIRRIADSDPKKLRRKNEGMKRKIGRLNKKKIVIAQGRCAKLEEESLLEKVEDLNLNDSLKENIRNCIRVAKVSAANGIRYSQKWLFECILLKIKNTKTYEHLRSHGIMPLPHPTTILRYLRQLQPTYGFQSGVFDLLGSKSAVMKDMEKEGCLLIDEMNLQETYTFDKNNTMKVMGFTDLGKHTPEAQKDKLGNHALVLMFQPFLGSWVQPIGCFLSRGAAPSDVLYQILLEAVILLENSGLRVNAITSDGAQWNRGMWSLFGVSEGKVYSEHPSDPERKLWFLSDFPHLIKNLRNWMLRMKVFKTPDGKVRIAHWKELLKAEKNSFKLRSAFKLTENHLKPKNYEKMNVTLAYQLFDNTMADSMELYQDRKEHVAELYDCEATCKFIRRIAKLIKAASSRTPTGALRGKGIDSAERKDIEEFIKYLDEWEEMHPIQVTKRVVRRRTIVKKTASKASAKKEVSKVDGEKKKKPVAKKKQPIAKKKVSEVDGEKKKKPVAKKKQPVAKKTASGETKPPVPPVKKQRNGFLTVNTCVGLKVTLRSILEILEYLTMERGFTYLMTARLNQDNLEKFFGMVRAAGGNNDHPDSGQFPFLYRLISAYSLLKPPKGSNVSNEEAFTMFTHLMSDNNRVIGREKANQLSLAKDIWSLVSDIEDEIDEIFDDYENRDDKTDSTNAEWCIIEQYAGYVAKNAATKFTKCVSCINSLQGDRNLAGKLLRTRDKFDVLFIPSPSLVKLFTYLENKIDKEIDGKISNVTRDTFFNVCRRMDRLNLDVRCSTIGCTEHSRELTSKLLYFYITTRMHFIMREAKKQLRALSRNKALKKQSKCVN